MTESLSALLGTEGRRGLVLFGGNEHDLAAPLQPSVLLLRQAALSGPGQRGAPETGLPARAAALWSAPGEQRAHERVCPGDHHAGASGQRSVGLTQPGRLSREGPMFVSAATEQYFSGDGLTLSERFSAPQSAELSEDAEELTLNQRFSSNR